MKGRFRKYCFMLFLVFACSYFQKQDSRAAVAQITIQKSQQDIVKGDTFYVIVTITSDEEINGFEGYFSYNQNVMQFVTGGSVASGNDDEIHIKDLERETGTRKIKYSLQFRARKAGTSSVALKRYRQIKKAEEDTKLSVGSASLEIEVISSKEYQAKIQRQERQQGLQQTQGRPEEETVESPVASMPAGDVAGHTSDMKAHDDAADGDNTFQMEDVTSEKTEFQEKPKGLNRKIYLIILSLAVIGFVIVVSLLVNALKEAEAEEPEETEGTEAMERTDQNIIPEAWDDPDPAGREKRLDEIEKRLEEKRRWLRKE